MINQCLFVFLSEPLVGKWHRKKIQSRTNSVCVPKNGSVIFRNKLKNDKYWRLTFTHSHFQWIATTARVIQIFYMNVVAMTLHVRQARHRTASTAHVIRSSYVNVVAMITYVHQARHRNASVKMWKTVIARQWRRRKNTNVPRRLRMSKTQWSNDESAFRNWWVNQRARSAWCLRWLHWRPHWKITKRKMIWMCCERRWIKRFFHSCCNWIRIDFIPCNFVTCKF